MVRRADEQAIPLSENFWGPEDGWVPMLAEFKSQDPKLGAPVVCRNLIPMSAFRSKADISACPQDFCF
jgi:hypothetical protein